MIHRSRDTGAILTRLTDRLLQDPLTDLYYISTRGKLGPPLVEPPPSMMEPQPKEVPTITQQYKTRTIGKLKAPDNRIKELTATIGVNNIPLFLRYLKEMLNMHPVRFITQNRGIRNLIETEHFPKWLEKIGAA